MKHLVAVLIERSCGWLHRFGWCAISCYQPLGLWVFDNL